MAKELEIKSIPFEATIEKKDDTGEFYLEGYVAKYNVKDSGGDILLPGAFSHTLASKEIDRVVCCFNHDFDQPVGVPTFEDRPDGLYMKARIIDTQRGSDLIKMVKAGAVKEMSFMYAAIDYEEKGIRGTTSYTRTLKKVDIAEAGPVTRAMNKFAKITGYTKDDFMDGITTISDEQLCQLKKSVSDEEAKRIINKLNF